MLIATMNVKVLFFYVARCSEYAEYLKIVVLISISMAQRFFQVLELAVDLKDGY